eukprot:gene8848-4310_t
MVEGKGPAALPPPAGGAGKGPSGGALHGTVKRWLADKGIGWVTNDADGSEVFVHHSDLGGGSLAEGGRVTFDLGRCPAGKKKAVNISGDVGPRMAPDGGIYFWKEEGGRKGGGRGRGAPPLDLVGGAGRSSILDFDEFPPSGSGKGPKGGSMLDSDEFPSGGSGKGRMGGSMLDSDEFPSSDLLD